MLSLSLSSYTGVVSLLVFSHWCCLSPSVLTLLHSVPLSARTEEGLEVWDRDPTLFTFIQILQKFDNLKGESLNFLLAPPARQTLSYQSGNWFILKVRSN